VRFIDLFCGIGGLSYGLKMAGLMPLIGVDINERACRVYNEFVEPVFGALKADIFKLPPNKLPDAEIIVGCPPCQGFSSVNGAGRERKKYDKRNDLIRFFTGFVYVKKPLIFFFENVPPLINSKRFRNMVRKLSELYEISYDIIDLGTLGGGPWEPVRPLTHRRRLVCIGIRKDLKVDVGKLFPESSNSPLPVGKLLEVDPEGDNRRRKLSDKLRTLARYISPGMKRDEVPDEIKYKYFYKCWLNTDGFKDVFSRIHPEKPLPYVTGGILHPDKGPFLHPFEDRGFTVEEAKFIMSFPRELDLRSLPLKDAENFIGNAFPPQSAYAFGIKIKKVLHDILIRQEKEVHKGNIEFSAECGYSVA